jgi:Transposase, Mutator family
VKIREDNVVRNKAVYLALGVRRDGTREILGLWIETTEGAKFWMKVFNDLRTRGVLDILGAADAFRHIGSLREPIAVTDGLTGMPAALEAFEHAPAEAGGWRMGAEVPHRGGGLAPGLGAGDPVLHLSTGDQAGDLHHQRD